MKRFLTILTLAALAWGRFTPAQAQQQAVCFPPPATGASATPQSPGPSSNPGPVIDGASCDAPAVHYVRVNVHYMLKSDGSGNFTESDDAGSYAAKDWGQAGPNGGPLPTVNPSASYNGYQFAEDIVSLASSQLADNQQMELPVGNTTPVLAPRIAYTLGGVYFHRDSDLYDYNQIDNYTTCPDGVYCSAQFDAYGVNKAQEINIFLMGQSTNPVVSPGQPKFRNWAYLSGAANQFGYQANNNWVKIGNIWRVHLLIRSRNNGVDNEGAAGIGRVLNHEIGHKLKLFHPFGGDNCADTPRNLTPSGDEDAGAGNNLMDYGHQVALTPCQIDIMQTALQTDYESISTCSTCAPPNAFFTLPSLYVNGPNASPGCLSMDARASYLETSFQITISKFNASNQLLPPSYTRNYLGTADNYCLSNQFTFERNTRYAVKLTVYNQCASSTLTKYVETRDENVLYERGAAPLTSTRPVSDAPPALYPNPATSAGFTLHSPAPLTEAPLVRDSQGRLIPIEPAGQVQDEAGWHTTYRLHSPQLGATLYLVEVRTAGKRTVHRLSVQAE